MERLTKKQREILKYLKKFHSEGKPYSVVTDDVFSYAGVGIEIEILVEKGLIELCLNGEPYKPKGRDYPESVILNITPKGIVKLRETFFTRIQDTAWKNPWAVIAIILSVILGLIALWK
jgi:predicted nucleotidyltransferase